MKTLIIVIIFTCAYSNVNSQIMFGSLTNSKLETKYNTVRNNRFTLGMGFKKALPTKSDISINDKVYFTLTSGLLFYINKPFYLYTGADIQIKRFINIK